MDHRDPDGGKPASRLTSALRLARFEEAERSQALGELRHAEFVRLQVLRDAIDPILAQVPAEVDLFDVGVVPGEHPRLFIDMIAFVEMGRDRRLYRFVQDTRAGRILIAESETLGVMVEAITRYIARRLIEREKLLAALDLHGGLLHPSIGESRLTKGRRGSRLLTTMLGVLRIGIDVLGLVTLVWLLWFFLHDLRGPALH